MNDLRLPMTFEEAKQILEMEIDWDWEKFRRETAKDVLPAVIAKKSSMCSFKEVVKEAVQFADELIKQLKENEK